MLNLQTQEYMRQMDSNIGDKTKLLQWIKHDGKVLDAGCGGGELTLQMLNNWGLDAYGIDLSLISYENFIAKGIKDRFIHGNLLDMSIYFNKEEFDTIIFSSVLHEIYSYNGFHLGDIDNTLENALKALKTGGRIIIRDGVKSARYGYRRVKFKNKNDILFLTEYCRRFKGRNIWYKIIDNEYFEMKTDDMMEFLYTYTWGWESFDREVQEQYGVHTLEKYEMIARRMGAKIIHSEEYLQQGYVDSLSEKIEIYDEDMNPVDLPSSNMILVIEKQ